MPDAELLAGTGDTDLFRENAGHTSLYTSPDRLLSDGDQVGSLRVIATPEHSPGHLAFQDQRDGTLYVGDALVNVPTFRVVTFLSPLFPLPTLGTWDRELALQSARKLLEPVSTAIRIW